MDTKTLIDKVIAAFDNNDPDAILSLLADDVEWRMVSDDKVLNGKAAIKESFDSMGDIKMTDSKKDHIIISGNLAAVDGTTTMSDGKGKTSEVHYCDIYETENGLVKKMISYMVERK